MEKTAFATKNILGIYKTISAWKLKETTDGQIASMKLTGKVLLK